MEDPATGVVDLAAADGFARHGRISAQGMGAGGRAAHARDGRAGYGVSARARVRAVAFGHRRVSASRTGHCLHLVAGIRDGRLSEHAGTYRACVSEDWR